MADGSETELAAAVAWFREDPKRLDFAPITEWSRHLRTIVRAYLASPAGPAVDTAAPDAVVVPRVHLRSWVDFLRALVEQDAIRALNARDAVLDNARQIESWAGQPGRDSQPEATDD